ncbi:MAG: hypothetical protein HY717_07735, partial [Planctomycetes bacterium]|nr:hypothetical protein [Planctomycetota bacterium]
NGDGRADLAIAGSSYIIVLLNEGPEPCEFGGLQLPGDANQDGQLDLSDAIWLLEHLFLGTVKNLPCEGQTAGDPGNGERRLLDSNGDKQIDLSDAVGVLVFLFLGNAPPVLGTHCVAIPGCPDACRP